jgi:hypothetical protein
MKFHAVLAACSLSSILVFAADSPVIEGPKEQAVGLNEGNTMQAEFRLGASGKIAFGLKFADGKAQWISGTVKPEQQQRSVLKNGKRVLETSVASDALIEFQGAGLRFENHIRPCLKRYTDAQQAELLKTWDALPSPAQSWVPLEVRADAAGAELWMEGKFCGNVASGSRLTEVSFKLEEGGTLRDAKTFTRADTGSFLPLDVRSIARPGAMKDASVSVKPGMQQLEAVPMIVGSGAANADVGAVKEMQGGRALETNEYTSRTSLDGMPESELFSVPQAFYSRAWVLCAVEPDEKKDPVLTTRLTRFATSGRGGAMADTTLRLPRGGEQPGAGLKKVGVVDYTAADGKKVAVPLYLVPVDLQMGAILDLLAAPTDPYAPMKIGPYLDFEFLGQCGGLQVQNDRRRQPLATSTSAVHVFGATLEKSPVELRLKQSQPGNIFHNDERPETAFALRANAPGAYTLKWEIADVAGQVLQSHEKTVELKTPGAEAEITVPLAMPELGWYALRITLRDAAGHTILQHDGAFALLGQDTRQAGLESPFGTWWFGGAHYTTRDLSIVGPLMMKAGLRRTPVGWTKDTEADLAPWKMGLNQIQWQFRLIDLDNWPAAEARAEKSIGDMLARFPHCQYIDLFHESYDPGAFPPELYGGKYQPKDEKQAQQEDRLFELGVKAAKSIRAKFPQLKIIAGNSGGSSGMIAVLLRRGFPRELFDYIGSETTGQTIAPEKITPHTTGGIWLMGETARKFGYEAPLTGCFEFTSRAERDLGAQRLAEWYADDCLWGLANRFVTLSPAGLEDVGNSYYDTLWGASGLTERKGLHYPKPAYVALATLTQVLDSVHLVQQMPTGSSSAHALEFTRGNEHIYAVWAPRGQCAMQFEFPAETSLTSVGFYGQQKAAQTTGKRFALTAGTAVRYLISPIAAAQVTAGRRDFPDNQPPAGTHVVARMDDLAQWQLAPEETPITTPTRQPGKFELRQVTDPEKGACLELALQRQGDLPAIVGEYTALRLKEPVLLPGRPHTVGVWVRGDSSGGRIFWEIEDAKGERWRSSGGYDGGDWGNHSAIDFDGWCFVTFPLTNDSPVKHIEPGPGLGQWQHEKGDGVLDYPLKLTGLFIQTSRQSVDLTRMAPVKQTIRLKDVSVIGDEQ